MLVTSISPLPTRIFLCLNLLSKRKNYRLVQTESICRNQNECDRKLKFVWEGLTTLCEKEKMLVTSIFSFSRNVFKKLLFQGCEQPGFVGKAEKIQFKLHLGVVHFLLNYINKKKKEM